MLLTTPKAKVKMGLPSGWTQQDVLALSYIKSINSSLLRSIVQMFFSLEDFIEHGEKEPSFSKILNSGLFQGMMSSILDEAQTQAQKQLDLCHSLEAHIITIWDEGYPLMLKEIDLPPVMLFVKGTLQNYDSTSIAVVGTRRHSSYGQMCAEHFSGYFARNGIIVTSGLANGIDSIAHQAAINSNGITYAVLGSGVDKIGNSQQTKLGEAIVEAGGALISEYRCGTPATPAYFPQRNRIISGISKAILVVESKEKGGSLITAKFAFQQQREVYAIPGQINSERSAGTNNLIKQQIASIALSPSAMAAELGVFNEDLNLIMQNNSKPLLSDTENKLLDMLDKESMHIDDIAIAAGLDASQIMVTLLELEFKGYVKQLPGKYYIKKL